MHCKSKGNVAYLPAGDLLPVCDLGKTTLCSLRSGLTASAKETEALATLKFVYNRSTVYAAISEKF
jgi:hypothetical protein